MAIGRTVVFTSDLNHSVKKAVFELATRFPDREWLVLLHSPSRPVSRIVRNQFRNLRRHGWRWIPHLARLIGASLQNRVRRRPEVHPDAPGLAIDAAFRDGRHGIRTMRVPSVNGPEGVRLLTGFAPDLGISLAAPILRERAFSVPRHGTINLHKGKVPEYRGMPPAFWELKNGESEVGCTVHRIEAGLDTGAIIVERTVPRERYSTVGGMQRQLDRLGIELMCEAFGAFDAGTQTETAQREGGRTYTRPTLAEERALRRRLAGGRRGLRSAAKDAVLSSYASLARPLPSRVLGLRRSQRIVILLYHRVSDEFRDEVTVGIEQFDRQMAWLGSRCTVVPTSDIVHGRIPVSSPSPVIAVTFDDGYLDNWENAAPILERYRIPATFFISTGFIGENRPFPHDAQKLGRTVPAMTWDQIEQLQRLGFTIGAHTVNHIDCGATEAQTVRAELIESRDVLREKLGLDEVFFAFPYGRRHNITPGVIEMLKQLGYTACFSAWGGYQRGVEFDRYDIRRVGLGSNFSMAAFRASLAGFY